MDSSPKTAWNDTAEAWIFYAHVDEFWRKEEKYSFLEKAEDWQGIAWQTITPNKQHAWLTAGLQTDFETFLPIGTKEAKAGDENAIFMN